VRHNRHITSNEQRIYDHFLYWVEQETPSELVERFQRLFIDGSRYSDPDITRALDAVVSSKLATEEFRYVLNRCCHILINRWQSHYHHQFAIPDLIASFDEVSALASPGLHRSRSVRRLRELTRQFTDTEQYIMLRRLAQVLSQSQEVTSAAENRPLGTLIHRYPYLFGHCLLSEDSTGEQQRTVRTIQSQVQHQFEIDLSQYVTYKVRQNQVARQHSPEMAQRLIHPVPNPTLLGERELGQALKHYVGRVSGNSTHRDMAHSFLHSTGKGQSFGSFKADLYSYITSAVDSSYGNRQFNRKLADHLKNTFPTSEDQAVSDFLVVRTCSQLLNFLVVDNSQQPEHFILIDLLTNLGPVLTTSLLLRIVLICRKVKPCLEKRFAVLFNHYEAYTRNVVVWLVNALEHMNIALSTNFGAMDLSFIR
jgi:hypothetical protein